MGCMADCISGKISQRRRGAEKNPLLSPPGKRLMLRLCNGLYTPEMPALLKIGGPVYGAEILAGG